MIVVRKFRNITEPQFGGESDKPAKRQTTRTSPRDKLTRKLR